ncbi:MAG: NUDIX hydrolase, partial [Thermoanaerobaculia bacterium]|nr:NUDIX hydrolase [Thermoanaerobaculia bacterium]
EVRDDQLPRGAGGAEVVPAVPAASVIVMRGEPFEVLFLKRTSTSSFVPDAWVFPGGAVDPIDREIADGHLDGTESDAMRVCALRELFEESGIWLGSAIEDVGTVRRELLDDPALFEKLFASCAGQLHRLVWTSRWITPIGIPKRFDTWFFLLEVGDEQEATAENREGVEVRWLRPAEALRRHRARELPMVFPTIRNLEAIVDEDSASRLIESRKSATVEPVQPTLIVEEGRKRIVLPEEE